MFCFNISFLAFHINLCVDFVCNFSQSNFIPFKFSILSFHSKFKLTVHFYLGSPFRVMVNNPLDASKVKCYGPGIMPEGPVADSPTTFTIDTADAGEGLLCVTINDELGLYESM